MFDNFVKEEVKKLKITDTLVSHLVKKKRRGTYQALEESKVTEEEISDAVVEYIHSWLIGQFLDGPLKDQISKEVLNAVNLELARKGFDQVQLQKNKRLT